MPTAHPKIPYRGASCALGRWRTGPVRVLTLRGSCDQNGAEPGLGVWGGKSWPLVLGPVRRGTGEQNEGISSENQAQNGPFPGIGAVRGPAPDAALLRTSTACSATTPPSTYFRRGCRRTGTAGSSATAAPRYVLQSRRSPGRRAFRRGCVADLQPSRRLPCRSDGEAPAPAPSTRPFKRVRVRSRRPGAETGCQRGVLSDLRNNWRRCGQRRQAIQGGDHHKATQVGRHQGQSRNW